MPQFVRPALACGALMLLVPSTASAQVQDPIKVGRWNGGALVRNGEATQCIVASRFKGAPGPTDAKIYAVIQSISRTSGLAVAFQDKDLKLEPGRAVEVELTIDGQRFAEVEGKAVGPDVVAVYPRDPAAFRAAYAGATAVVARFAGTTYGYPAEGSAEVIAALQACADRHGFAPTTFDAGRAEEEKKLGR